MTNENLQQIKMSSRKTTTVTSVQLLVDVLVILISRCFSVVEGILVLGCCFCILLWLPKRNTHRVTLRRSVMEKEKKHRMLFWTGNGTWALKGSLAVAGEPRPLFHPLPL